MLVNTESGLYIMSSDSGGYSLALTSSNDNAIQASEDEADTSPTTHRRSLSGSLLARFPFLRSHSEHHDSRNEDVTSDTKNVSQQTQPTAGITAAVVPKKGRPRKSSLRKTALLGGKRLHLGQRGPSLETIVSPRLDRGIANHMHATQPAFSPESDDSATPRASYEQGNTVYTKAHSGNGSHSLSVTSSDEHLPLAGIKRRNTSVDISTTDEDDSLDGHGATTTGSGASGLKTMPEESYFSLDPNGARRRPVMKAKSPLSTPLVETVHQPEEWDYTETEYWGWVILVVTWIVFVVGMGSCFEVWSWAWDVGETPYAPPELEDDPTLPIVGYYPALIILTGVMAWVWVLTAWVGMKYFRHARIPGEGV
jgi:hypothetical protein